MEIFQQKPWKNTRKRNMVTGLMTTVGLSIAANTNAWISLWGNNETPVVNNRVVEKKYTHKWPLGDKMCSYTYDTKEKVLQLCESKPPQVIERYTKFIPPTTTSIPGGTRFVPGGMSIVGGKPQFTPGWPVQNPPIITNIPGRTVSCEKIQHYSQINWEPSNTQEKCV